MAHETIGMIAIPSQIRGIIIYLENKPKNNVSEKCREHEGHR